MHRTRLLIALLCTALGGTLTACGTSGPIFEQEELGQQTAVVYIFRQSRSGGSASAFKIYANGQHITNLSNGGYFPYEAEPGKLHLKAAMKANVLNWGAGYYLTAKPELDVDVEAGKAYFVEFEFGGMGGPGLRVVSEDTGLDLIQLCKRTKPVE